MRIALSPSLLKLNPHLAPARSRSRRAPAVVTSSVTREGDAVVCVLDGVRLDVTPNSRGHWSVRSRHAKRVHALVAAALVGVTPPSLPARVTITRRSPASRPMDDDGATASAKYVRDAVATWLCVDDGDACVTWTVTRERASWGVVIRVESVTESAAST